MDNLKPKLDAGTTTTNIQGCIPVMLSLDKIRPRSISWLWLGRIPNSRITIIVGPSGVGKSFLTLDLAARVSTGACWPDGTPCDQGSVLLVAPNDNPSDTIRPRLEAQNADCGKIFLLSASSADSQLIEDALSDIPDCKLVVIDPIDAYHCPRFNLPAFARRIERPILTTALHDYQIPLSSGIATLNITRRPDNANQRLAWSTADIDAPGSAMSN